MTILQTRFTTTVTAQDCALWFQMLALYSYETKSKKILILISAHKVKWEDQLRTKTRKYLPSTADSPWNTEGLTTWCVDDVLLYRGWWWIVGDESPSEIKRTSGEKILISSHHHCYKKRVNDKFNTSSLVSQITFNLATQKNISTTSMDYGSVYMGLIVLPKLNTKIAPLRLLYRKFKRKDYACSSNLLKDCTEGFTSVQ